MPRPRRRRSFLRPFPALSPTLAPMQPRTLPVLRTPRLVLRLARPEDAPAIVRFFTENRAHLAPSRPRMGDEFFTEAFWRAQARAARIEFEGDHSLRLFLFDAAAPEEVVGSLNFTGFVRGAAQCCNVGYGVAREREGQGLMREALERALAYVFDELNVHRVMANFVPRNRRSGRLLRGLGFEVEGFAKDFLRLDGRWEDHVLTSRVNPRWRDE